ncbi:helix-turn-helix domain-containing protein [Pseudonocardia charpentierae]|uniref:Helix-turn-helix transcriptional regulator n=1 Tax=Pseudonocardia charpentierae TaxID=3075545 RepID=A0ABU2N6I0_9PSEU|nr:helix-turn-helix transcriptional regulator [Pseudonocardia sp. DSM 45834]MDT0349530.1 helix-turn-helix transcriptional regulator [Pseudonocardia sp. DSM 45834]
MALAPRQAVRLARALRELRESEWPDSSLTQAQLAAALSSERSRVAPATLSSWESLSNPKAPPPSRLSAYARFFASRRSLEPKPHLLPVEQLTPDEHDRFKELEEHLLGLFHTGSPEQRNTFSFDEGPITIICPELPEEERGPLADKTKPNFNRLQQFADIDALLEIWGHIRAENPALEVRFRLPNELAADDFQAHVVLLGGVGWNDMTRRIQSAIKQVPITQVDDPSLKTGDIFKVKDTEGERRFYPIWDDGPDGTGELVEDVAQIVRLRSPFQSSRTLTICNGIHSRGVLGGVRCLTDRLVREANERYLIQRFPEGHFALLLRVPVVSNASLSPDLQDPYARLYEWAPSTEIRG